MAYITDYDSLIDNLVQVTEDDGAEFLAYLPTAVGLAEDRLVRENDFPEISSDTTNFLTTGSPDPALPSAWNYINFFYIKAGLKNKMLIRKQDDFLIDYWPDEAIRGEPKYYSLDGDSGKLKVVPPADATYEYTIRSVNSPTKLSTTNQTNIFIVEAPELLFHACMVACARFLKMWDQVPIWEQAYLTSQRSWNGQAQRQRRDDGETPHNPDGGQNTVLHTLGSNSTA